MSKIILDSNVFINAFKADSEFREESVLFLQEMSRIKQQVTMPSHGLFEYKCTLKKIEEIDKTFSPPDITNPYPIEAIHIDYDFIKKYVNLDIPYTKAGDHLYMVVAKHNNYPLITRDKGMSKRAVEAQINVFTPTEYLESL